MPLFFTKETKNKKEVYTDLDGAGIIYPYVANKKWNSVFRVEAKLKTNVNLIYLEDAVKEMKRKYPYFFSCISSRGTKYVLKKGYSTNVIYKNAPMCRPFELEDGETLIRVVYTNDSVGVEFFHALTDGHGAQVFFNELLKEYFNIAFSDYGYDNQRLNTLPVNEELLRLNDIFDDIYSLGGKSVGRFTSKAYQFSEKAKDDFYCESISVSLPALKLAAHKHSLSVSQYLCAVQTVAIIKSENVKNKKVRISVPVDLRKFFDFPTARNASLYALIEADTRKNMSFDELCASVKSQFKSEFTHDKMQNLAYSNVKLSKLKAYKMLPIPLKKVALNIGFTSFGENQFTSTLTNLGSFKPDSAVENVVSGVYFVLGRQKTKPLNLAVTTYGSETQIVVSSEINSSGFVGAFREILLSDGVPSAVSGIGNVVKIIDSADFVS